MTVSVKDYGATGNGITNDYQAITNAIAALQPYDTLVFPGGTYFVDDSLIFNKSNVTIDFGASCILGPTTDRDGIAIIRADSNDSRYIGGHIVAQTTTNLNNCVNSNGNRNLFTQMHADATHGLRGFDVQSVGNVLNSNVFESCFSVGGESGFSCLSTGGDGLIKNTTFNNCHARNTEVGFLFNATTDSYQIDGINLISSTAETCTAFGYNVSRVRNVVVMGFQARNCGYHGGNFWHCVDGIVEGNIISGNGNPSNGFTGVGSVTYGGEAAGFTVAEKAGGDTGFFVCNDVIVKGGFKLGLSSTRNNAFYKTVFVSSCTGPNTVYTGGFKASFDGLTLYGNAYPMPPELPADYFRNVIDITSNNNHPKSFLKNNLILIAPNGKPYTIKVNNNGNLSADQVA